MQRVVAAATETVGELSTGGGEDPGAGTRGSEEPRAVTRGEEESGVAGGVG